MLNEAICESLEFDRKLSPAQASRNITRIWEVGDGSSGARRRRRRIQPEAEIRKFLFGSERQFRYGSHSASNGSTEDGVDINFTRHRAACGVEHTQATDRCTRAVPRRHLWGNALLNPLEKFL
jgi:hypothetical protein